MQRWPLRQVAFIGLGLIGSSLARLLRERGLVERITAASRSRQTLATAQQLGIIDIGYANPADAVRGADLVILAMPVNATEAVMAAIKPALSQSAVVTDVGSTKGNVVAAAEAVWGHVPATFVPGHPIAGSEQSGVMAGRADLFAAHKVILTPLTHTSADAVALVTALWQAAGAEVMTMRVEQHDAVLARTSHLPHLLAFSLVDTLAQESDNLDIFRYAAGGFRDFTRIAASDPRMWHDIFLANRDAVISALDAFEAGTQRVRDAITSNDSDALLGMFTRARAAREHFTHMLAGTAYAKSMTHTKELRFTVEPGGNFTGRARVPGDKSISHRSIMLGSLATGVTDVTGFLEGEDALATLQAFRDMGVVIEGPTAGRVRVHGVGLHGLKAPPGPIYVGNSGTTMRLLSGLLSAQPFNAVLTGDASLAKRPMERIAKPLRMMGADIQTTGERGTPPVTITGNAALKGIHYDMPIASAQVKSGVLLAGLWAQGTTSVTEPAPTRDHTERMLRGFGYAVKTEGATANVQGGGKLTATQIDVPADISSAAFFLVAASIAPDSDLVLEHVGMNPTRVGVINILRAMGGNIEVLNSREVGGEPVADLHVRSAQLKGIDIPEDQVPLAIDEFPSLFIAAACAEGVTTLTGAEELRVKESDRIQVMADGLLTLGVSAVPTADGIVITGGPIGSGEVISHGDHRIAMSFAMAGLRATGPIVIRDCANVATSFPDFIGLARRCGLRIRASEHDLH
ncbi:3-phosphoshikimate 1-carboxyvinyltransferase [Paraperlucidibaca baekdonensis]|uniref:3-phosphoshikimate 1-carboxyvinyltransferase n=1 Tax=Paraperlucidibaca baekdonensis TaxID=748120 RepID=A0A3E0H2W9_9GAMM|nr:bifunctional prephenate dehydrogenase/3-phosphoshikimate 1-carboxyvinyltransferase [Paraperlucidibaca baekdonensis]REH36868.1 3-phosphoshikimate 1-carboxyvinyltransferase [Paraperlucidibaca baekdonensis]